MLTTISMWGGFLLLVFAVLAVDLGLANKKAHAVSTKEAAAWTAVWVTLAFLFNIGLYVLRGPQPALEFLTGYLIEYSLSIDNIFVFIMLFSYFRVEAAYRHQVLFWGILGALLFRAGLIGVGAALITRFHWVMYIFGLFLIYSGIKMALAGDEEPDPERNPVVTWFKRIFPVTSQYHGDAFFIRQGHPARTYATPLFVVLLIVETTDIMFALDSIPAIFAVTKDPYIVFTSNVFAILGLRSLYFLLDGIMGLFRFLKYGLTLVLSFIGLKMLLTEIRPISTPTSLGVVVGILAISILLSVLMPAPPAEER